MTQLSFRSMKDDKPAFELSAYGFFDGNLADHQPAEDVYPYSINTPLFSDYAEKLRFFRLPKDSAIIYNPDSVLQFPVGSEIIKTFFYYKDFRNPDKGRTLIETRVLKHEESGWKTYPYVWNDEQTDAYLDVAGDRKNVQWIDEKGKKQKLEYVIPNVNQCKNCHIKYNELTPIGPSARQMHQPDTKVNSELLAFAEAGLLIGLPEDHTEIPHVPLWEDDKASINDRARAYLDINCAHCHNPGAPANTSGLWLGSEVKDINKLGVHKVPIAAGRGSGKFDFDIEPGKPESSILLFRMESEDPGIRMPEIGRKMIHEEGNALIREWIKNMD